MRAAPGTARGFFRARGVLPTMAALVVVCALAGVAGRVLLRLPSADSAGRPTTLPLALVTPVLLACLVVAAVRSRYAAAERLATRPVGRWTVVHLVTMVAVTSLLLGVATIGLDGALTAPAAIRNFWLLTGAGLVLVPIVGTRLAPLTPVALAAWFLTGGAQWSYNPLLRPDGSVAGGLLGVLVLVVGTMVAASVARRPHVLEAGRDER